MFDHFLCVLGSLWFAEMQQVLPHNLSGGPFERNPENETQNGQIANFTTFFLIRTLLSEKCKISKNFIDTNILEKITSTAGDFDRKKSVTFDDEIKYFGDDSKNPIEAIKDMVILVTD